MNRRDFFRRSALVLPALVVGEEAVELLARLTHQRKTFPSAQLTATEVLRLRNGSVIEFARGFGVDLDAWQVTELLSRSNQYLRDLQWKEVAHGIA